MTSRISAIASSQGPPTGADCNFPCMSSSVNRKATCRRRFRRWRRGRSCRPHLLLLLALASALVVLASGGVASSFAADRVVFCDSDRTDGDDMRARNIRCSTARRVYSRSLRVALRDPDAAVVRFRLYGLRWTCRARNTDIYEWRCRASGRRLMRYRWLGGE